MLPNNLRCPISRSECRRFVCGELHRTNDPIGHGGLGSNDHCRIEQCTLPHEERQRPSITFPGLSCCTSSTASNEPPNWGLIEAIDSNLALQASLLLLSPAIMKFRQYITTTTAWPWEVFPTRIFFLCS